MLPRLRSDHRAAMKWLAKQALYHNQVCPLCRAKETQDHALRMHIQQALHKLEDAFKMMRPMEAPTPTS